MQLGIRRLPPNNDRACNQQPQKRWHQYRRYEPFTKIEFPDRHTDRLFLWQEFKLCHR